MSREFTGRHMFILTTAFFAIVISVNILLAVFAVRSWTGMVVPNSYVASQQFNEKTAALEQAAAMGIRAWLTYGGGKISITLRDAANDPVRAASLALKIGRPSNESEDRSLTMACGSGGVCSAETLLGQGIWSGQIEAELAGGRRWTRAVRFLVNGEQAR